MVVSEPPTASTPAALPANHPHARHRAWVLLLVIMLLAPPVFFFWYRIPPEQIPVELLLPARLAAGVRVTNLPQAWNQHWLQRASNLPEGMPAPSADEALRRVLDALEQWPEWVKDYGESGAKIRLQLYQQTLFQALGDDAWLLFGQWEEAPLAEASPTSRTLGLPPVGLVILLKSRGPLSQQVGPLIDLALGAYELRRTRHHGISIYEYRSKRMGRSISFCQFGGWIVASWRQHGPGPLPALIDRARNTPPGSVPRIDPQLAELLDTRTTSTLRGVFKPETFWAALRQFTVQRGKSMSRKSEDRLVFWQQRLEGTERIALRQHGDSLLGLEASITGAAPRRWFAQWRQESESTTTLGAAASPHPTINLLGSNAAPQTEIAQLDLDLPFARFALPLAGYEWDDLLGNAAVLDLLAPGLRSELNARLTPWSTPAGGRIGLAAYPGAAPLFPDLLGWIDLPPLRNEPGAPARRWRELAHHREWLDPSDRVFFIQPPFAPREATLTTSTATVGWANLVERAWTSPPSPPPLVLGINFREAAKALERIPPKLLKKKDRKLLQRWHRTLGALSLGAGAAAARVDVLETEVHVRLETL